MWSSLLVMPFWKAALKIMCKLCLRYKDTKLTCVNAASEEGTGFANTQ